jgi:hypothetical protein
LLSIVIPNSYVFAQPKLSDKADSAKNMGISFKQGPKSYADFFPEKVHVKRKEGLLTILQANDRCFLEITDELLGKDILCVSRMIQSAAELRSPEKMLGYGGDQVNENEIRFEKGPNNKIFIRQISYAELSKDSTQAMFHSVSNSNLQSIAAAFDVKAFAKDKNGVIIDVTDFLNGDNDLLFFDPSIKKALKIGSFQPDKSYIIDIDTYPANTEIKAEKTYLKGSSNPDTPPSGTVTVQLNCSMILLPEKPMQVRYADDRIGYFRNSYTDFDTDPQNVKLTQTITRWRLEPKDGDMGNI